MEAQIRGSVQRRNAALAQIRLRDRARNRLRRREQLAGGLRRSGRRWRVPVARPVFVRLLPALEATGTFKPRKHDLVREGFDPARTGDPLYFDDPRADRYVPVDLALYAAIAAGHIRV